MTQLLLIFCGSRLVRKKWWILFVIGALWAALGIFLWIDALDGVLIVPARYFTIPLILDGAWALMTIFSTTGVARLLRMVKAITCLLVAVLILAAPNHSGMIIGYLVGIFLCVDSCWRGASAWVVQYPGWPRGIAVAIFEFLFGFWSFLPWPDAWEAEVSIDIGTLLLVTACSMCMLAFRLRRVPSCVPIASILSRGAPLFPAGDAPGAAFREKSSAEMVTVHVWTPTDSMVPVNRGVSRYVAAPNKHGVISTGHSALELGLDLYISHYPAVEIDRSGSEFARMLRATPDNNVPGLFQPSYAEECSNWSPSTMQVSLPGLDGDAVRRFWKAYRVDSTYNLTNRNCSSAVAAALDAGMDGIFEKKMTSLLFCLHLLLMPELRVAGFLRARATAMAWTPGITLDYVRALSHIISTLGSDVGKEIETRV